jgi:hypothetical protein
MRRHTRADCWLSVIGSAPSALTRPAFPGDPQVPVPLCP